MSVSDRPRNDHAIDEERLEKFAHLRKYATAQSHAHVPASTQPSLHALECVLCAPLQPPPPHALQGASRRPNGLVYYRIITTVVGIPYIHVCCSLLQPSLYMNDILPTKAQPDTRPGSKRDLSVGTTASRGRASRKAICCRLLCIVCDVLVVVCHFSCVIPWYLYYYYCYHYRYYH